MVSVYARITKPDENGSQAARELLLEAMRQRLENQTDARHFQKKPLLDALPLIEKDLYGKPYFPQYPDLHFSISHTKGCVCCALADSPVGVDVELCRQKKYRDQVVKKFSSKEQKLMEGIPEEKRQELFFCLWVLKESYVKADGRGLLIPLDSFSVLPGEWAAQGEEGLKTLSGNFYGNWRLEVEAKDNSEKEGQRPHFIDQKDCSLYLYEWKEVPYQLAVCSRDRDIETKIRCL